MGTEEDRFTGRQRVCWHQWERGLMFEITGFNTHWPVWGFTHPSFFLSAFTDFLCVAFGSFSTD